MKKVKFNIKWCTEKDHGDSHWWCDICGEIYRKAFVIDKVRGNWTICSDCMQLIQVKILPLSILVQTGKDTNDSTSRNIQSL